MARRTSYRPEYAEQVYKYALLGATDVEMAGFFSCAKSTFNKWKKEFPEFSDSIKRGKDQADAQVADKLFTRAIGYQHTETKTVKRKVGEVATIEMTETVKEVPPDVTAQIFWLKNRQRNKWRDKWDIDVNHKTPIPVALTEGMTLEDMSRAYEDKRRGMND